MFRTPLTVQANPKCRPTSSTDLSLPMALNSFASSAGLFLWIVILSQLAKPLLVPSFPFFLPQKRNTVTKITSSRNLVGSVSFKYIGDAE